MARGACSNFFHLRGGEAFLGYFCRPLEKVLSFHGNVRAAPEVAETSLTVASVLDDRTISPGKQAQVGSAGFQLAQSWRQVMCMVLEAFSGVRGSDRWVTERTLTWIQTCSLYRTHGRRKSMYLPRLASFNGEQHGMLQYMIFTIFILTLLNTL